MEREHIIKVIDDYCAATGLKPSTVCVYALKSQHLYDRLKGGGECLPRTAKKLLAWINENPPVKRDGSLACSPDISPNRDICKGAAE